MNTFIDALSGLFNWILMTSLMSSILVVLLFVVKFLLKGKLTARWQYALWFVCIARLIMPWTPETSFSMYNFFSFTNQQSQVSILHIGQSDTVIQGIQTPEQPTLITGQGTELLEESGRDTSKLPWGYAALLAVWVVGVLAFAAYLFWMNRKFNLKMKKNRIAAPDHISSILEQCKRTLRVKRNIPIWIQNEVEGPTLHGFLRPQLLLPDPDPFSVNEIRHILLHELVHYKRKDICINWLMTGLLILHWFNPLLWYAYKRLREDQELSCDEIAISQLPADEVKEYGNTIIKLIERTTQTLKTPAVTNFSSDRSQLKRRIMMIKLFKKSSSKWSLPGLVVLVFLAVLALTNAKELPQNKTIDSNSNGNTKTNITDTITPISHSAAKKERYTQLQAAFETEKAKLAAMPSQTQEEIEKTAAQEQKVKEIAGEVGLLAKEVDPDYPRQELESKIAGANAVLGDSSKLLLSYKKSNSPQYEVFLKLSEYKKERLAKIENEYQKKTKTIPELLEEIEELLLMKAIPQ